MKSRPNGDNFLLLQILSRPFEALDFWLLTTRYPDRTTSSSGSPPDFLVSKVTTTRAVSSACFKTILAPFASLGVGVEGTFPTEEPLPPRQQSSRYLKIETRSPSGPGTTRVKCNSLHRRGRDGPGSSPERQG